MEILELARRLPGGVYLVTEENPQEYDVGGSWAHAHHSTWALPVDCNLEALLARVLLIGDWRLYASHEPIDPASIPSVFAVSPSQFANFAFAHSVPLLVEAFHDDDPWLLWVEEVRGLQEAAA